MNREILFRGARLCDGKLVNGALVMVKENDESEKYVPNIVISYGPDTFDWFEVEPETVGQFTGLTDKNGTKIFEGDIVKEQYKSHEIIYNVFWDEDYFAFRVKSKDYSYYLDELVPSNSEVIGNIYDNKELLK